VVAGLAAVRSCALIVAAPIAIIKHSVRNFFIYDYVFNYLIFSRCKITARFQARQSPEWVNFVLTLCDAVPGALPTFIPKI
jgi:hypothetical protein